MSRTTNDFGSIYEQVLIPLGRHFEVFAVGGGGGADSSTAGASGFIKKASIAGDQTHAMKLVVTIGHGGSSSHNGQASSVSLNGKQIITAGGGGRGVGAGWPGVSGDTGGTNGQYGTMEPLPTLCSNKVQLSPGAAGVDASDGKGAGGVIVDGKKPTKQSKKDGEGFGAGGGEDHRSGYSGVVVLVLCD